MFEGLTGRLQEAFKKLRGKGKLTEADIDEDSDFEVGDIIFMFTDILMEQNCDGPQATNEKT